MSFHEPDPLEHAASALFVWISFIKILIINSEWTVLCEISCLSATVIAPISVLFVSVTDRRSEAFNNITLSWSVAIQWWIGEAVETGELAQIPTSLAEGWIFIIFFVFVIVIVIVIIIVILVVVVIDVLFIHCSHNMQQHTQRHIYC